MLERFLGSSRFLALYLTCGVAGSVAVLYFTPPHQPTLGASGGIFGLFGAAIIIMRSRGMDITSLLVLLGINMVITFAPVLSNISWQGDFGGLLAGLLFGAVFAYAPSGAPKPRAGAGVRRAVGGRDDPARRRPRAAGWSAGCPHWGKPLWITTQVSFGARPPGLRGYSHWVAKMDPTPIRPMPITRFQPPRSPPRGRSSCST